MKTIPTALYRGFSEVIDEVAILVASIGRKRRAFALTVDPPPMHDELIEWSAATPPRIAWPKRLDGPMRVKVELPMLGLDSFLDYWPSLSASPDTLMVHHHGLSEIPHDATARPIHRLQRLRERCDLIVLKAPFHETPGAVSERFLACRSDFSRYLAAQVATAKEVARALGSRYRFLSLSGVSMGGIIALGETAHDPQFDVTIPMLSGPRLYDVMTASSFRRNVARSFLRAEATAPWRDSMDLDDRLSVTDGPPVRAILARSDKLFRVEVQRAALERSPRARVVEFEGGHLTGAINIPRLARHVADALRETCWEASEPTWRAKSGLSEAAAACFEPLAEARR